MNPSEIPHFMKALRTQLESVKRFLDDSGFVFDFPDEVLPGVDLDTETIVSRVTSEIGEIPETLLCFYREIGSVNFCGHHDGWTGCDYPDPLVIYPPSAALTELDEYLSDQVEYDKCYGGFRIPIAPDYFHKEGVSGGMWYGIGVPADSPNPVVIEEHHGTHFLEYLMLNASNGFFLGLEDCAVDATWPIDKLRDIVISWEYRIK